MRELALLGGSRGRRAEVELGIWAASEAEEASRGEWHSSRLALDWSTRGGVTCRWPSSFPHAEAEAGDEDLGRTDRGDEMEGAACGVQLEALDADEDLEEERSGRGRGDVLYLDCCRSTQRKQRSGNGGLSTGTGPEKVVGVGKKARRR